MTIVTINQDPTYQTVNALKPGTKKLIKGFKVHDKEEQARFPRYTSKSPSEIRKASADGTRALKKIRGSAKQRRIVKTYAK